MRGWTICLDRFRLAHRSKGTRVALRLENDMLKPDHMELDALC